MKSFLLSLAGLFTFGGGTAFADKSEDLAKEAVLAFTKAVKEKDLDAVMKHLGAPFLDATSKEDFKVIKEIDDLKAFFKEKLPEVKADKVPTEVDKVEPWSKHRDKAIGDDKDKAKMVDDVGGKDALLVFLTADDKKVMLLVKVTDGKAKIVGIAVK